MTVSIHEYEAVVAERDALRREVAALRAEIDRLTTTQPEKREDLHCVISDLCTQVRDMEAHYKAALEAEQVRFRQLAASQARERQLRGLVESSFRDGFRSPETYNDTVLNSEDDAWRKSEAFHDTAQDADTTALQAMITKAGEVMRERAIAAASAINPIYGSGAAIDAIRTVRIVTLDDLKGGA